ncbi:hypothetical protein WDA79_06440 [Streptomyces sp. A475]|uniref:hypothetical protein n=1 Tax=Streptomyces sp. A475 TaxID=3131976 RepID=UPI0030C912A2
MAGSHGSHAGSGSDDLVPPIERSHWVAFAGILLMVSALFNTGFVAIYYSKVYSQGNRLLIVNLARS